MEKVNTSKMLTQEEHLNHLWAQCEHCNKWRRLPSGTIIDNEAPWYCNMNPDENKKSCEIPEEEYDELQEVVVCRYSPIKPVETNNQKQTNENVEAKNSEMYNKKGSDDLKIKKSTIMAELKKRALKIEKILQGKQIEEFISDDWKYLSIHSRDAVNDLCDIINESNASKYFMDDDNENKACEITVAATELAAIQAANDILSKLAHVDTYF